MPLPGVGPLRCDGKTKQRSSRTVSAASSGHVAADRSQPPAFGMICCGPPPLSAVSAYWPSGRARVAAPLPVLTSTASGAATNEIRAPPPSVITVAVAAATPRASSVPLPVSTCSGPVRPSTITPPPSLVTVSGPSIPVAWTGPLPESRLAPSVPETVTGPPSLAAVTVTPAGTDTSKPTLQPEYAHDGAARVRRPPETDAVTAGGPPFC